jgi:hypothetical protein
MLAVFDIEYIFNTYVESEKRDTGINSMIETCQELGATLEDTAKRVAKKFNLSQSEAETMVKEHWK